jgi:hypothetical protein
MPTRRIARSSVPLDGFGDSTVGKSYHAIGH